MQFQVPQFIEIEDKIFGPLTLKEFIYVAGGIGMSVIVFLFIPFKIISIPIIIVILVFSLSLAFYKVNGKPFVNTVESAFYYYFSKKLYIWRKAEKLPEKKPEDEIKKAKSMLSIPKLSDSKLKDLTWSLDIKESVNNTDK